ncbi:MAG: hydroxylamine oxidoreductase [Alphaproteobacteria bacterium]
MPHPLKLLAAALLIWLWAAAAQSGMDKDAKGIGLYGDDWRPEPAHEYWDPGTIHRPETERVEGRFTGPECIDCHRSLTPGIVNDWTASRHATPAKGDPVTCDACHGNDHQALRFPTPADCGSCHGKQHTEVQAERRYGFPSHALAMERVVDAKHFVDKPKAEVTACVQCHSVATKCDSCHTRHRFDAAEARRPEACLTCHSGPPHPDDEAYLASAHGRRYLAEGKDWDWSKPLRKGNYPVPTCAYCHMGEGRHQVADKAIWKFGLKEVNPLTAENKVKRRRWLAVCTDCHGEAEARAWLRDLDRERKDAWSLLDEAEKLLRRLRSADLLSPKPTERPPYPVDWWERRWPRAHIGVHEGQASAFYNVSGIERDHFEMWYFDNLLAYKGAAHGAPDLVAEGHRRLRRSLESLHGQADALQRQGEAEKKAGRAHDPSPLWTHGPYTDLNAEKN